MKCSVYRSIANEGLFLYVSSDFSTDRLPDELKKKLGRMRLSVQFDLSRFKNLVQINPDELAEHLKEKGYHLCIRDPSVSEQDLEKAVQDMLNSGKKDQTAE